MPGGKGNIRPSDNPKPWVKGKVPKDRPKRGKEKPKTLLKLIQAKLYRDEVTVKIKGAMLLDRKGIWTGEYVDVKVNQKNADAISTHAINQMVQDNGLLKYIIDQESGKAVENIRMQNGEDDEGNPSGFVIDLK